MLLGVKVSCPVLALQADVLVNQKVAGGRVDGSADGEGDDNPCGVPMSLWSWQEQACVVGGQLTEGDQLRRDLLQAPQTLRDCVRCEGQSYQPPFSIITPTWQIKPQCFLVEQSGAPG